jgi:hypothetical protein
MPPDRGPLRPELAALPGLSTASHLLGRSASTVCLHRSLLATAQAKAERQDVERVEAFAIGRLEYLAGLDDREPAVDRVLRGLRHITYLRLTQPAPDGRNRGEPVAWRHARRVRRAAWRNGPAATLTTRSRPTQPIPPGAHTHRRTLTDSTGRSAVVLRTTIAPELGFGTKRPCAARKCSSRARLHRPHLADKSLWPASMIFMDPCAPRW